MQEGGNTVSVRTVRCRLQSSGLRGCVAVKKPFISKVNKVKRPKFAKAHKNWMCEQWGRVLWTDESKFNLVGSDRAVYVRRRPEEALAHSCTRKTVKHGRRQYHDLGSDVRQRQRPPVQGRRQIERAAVPVNNAERDAAKHAGYVQ